MVEMAGQREGEEYEQRNLEEEEQAAGAEIAIEDGFEKEKNRKIEKSRV